jgi:hypothetical protein
MNRRGYELYRLEQDADLFIRKVVLGSSPEVVAATYKPRPDATIELLPASRALREWLVENHRAEESGEARFAVLSKRDTIWYNPLERPDLLPQLAYLNCSDDSAVVTFLRGHGTPDLEFGEPRWDLDPPRGYKVGRKGDQVDFIPYQNWYDRSGSEDLIFVPIWELAFEAGRLRLAAELARTVKARDAAGAAAIIGPISSGQVLPFALGPRADSPFGRSLYEPCRPCWSPVSLPPEVHDEEDSVDVCAAKGTCPRPDPRCGWVLSNLRAAFGPCGYRRPVTPEEYLVAAHQAVADMLTFNPHLSTRTLAVSAVQDASLRPLVTTEFVPAVHEAVRDGIFGPFPSSDEIPNWTKSDLDWLFEHAARWPSRGMAIRQPIFTFHRVARGSVGAAWYQMLDLLVHFSELRRCEYCGALFGATHGGQHYCTAAKPGQRSACQQAAKKARQRAARKSDRENPKKQRRPRRAVSS